MLTVREVTSFPFRFYNFVGIKLFQWDDNDTLNKRQKYTLILTLIIFVMNFLCKFSCFLLRKYEDAQELTKLISYFGFAVNGVFKMLSVWIGRETLHAVIKDLEKNFPRTSSECHEYKFYEQYAFVKRHMYLLSLIHWSIAIVFMLFPIVQSSFEYLANFNGNGKFIYRFPYIMTYPFDHHTPAGFIFAYITQLIGGITVHSYFCGSDCLLLATIHLVNMQFVSLALRIKKFKSQTYEKDLEQLRKILKSGKIGEEMMSQEWYLADNRYQRMLILAIARSQRPAHLTAYKFFMISMESFANLMTTSYQFFTLLKARMEEHD
uniref:Odorant receptor n=1 Tax=Glossina palpalis gambiensis TaxID=67801 RepID=A0A1B0B1K4_9MUSC